MRITTARLIRTKKMEPIYIGNKELLNLPKTAFLSSRKISSDAVMKCYDWATEMREQGVCVMSGFHSKLEKDVFHFLSKGTQPIIVVLGRKMYKITPREWEKPLSENRLLIVSTNPTGTRHSLQSAETRNRYITKNAEKVVFGCLNTKSSLYYLYQELLVNEMNVTVLNSL